MPLANLVGQGFHVADKAPLQLLFSFIQGRGSTAVGTARHPAEKKTAEEQQGNC